MDKQIDSHFERVEHALSSLIDSTAKYHPTVAHARELEQADKALALGLEEVQTHQANVIRLQKLRAASSTLDTQIRDTIANLATTRKDVASTQAVKFPDSPAYPFTYEELLSYARRISKTTLPPPAALAAVPHTNGAAAAAAAGADGLANPDTPGADFAPGNSTPAPAALPTPGALPTPTQSQTAGPEGSQTTANTSFTVLPEGLEMHMNPLWHASFVPWPQEDQIRMGSLAATQMLINEGIDPAGYDPVAEEARRKQEEEERLAREDKERREREERDRALRENREKTREQEQRESYRRENGMSPGGQSSPVEKKQFHFTRLEMDDDSD